MRCLFSPNYPQDYPTFSRCEVVVTPQWSGLLHTHGLLDSNGYFDVDSTRYGTAQFSDLFGVVPKEAITWSTTYDGTEWNHHYFFLESVQSGDPPCLVLVIVIKFAITITIASIIILIIILIVCVFIVFLITIKIVIMFIFIYFHNYVSLLLQF